MKKDKEIPPAKAGLGRRDLMKFGAGVVVTSLSGAGAMAQDAAADSAKGSTAAAADSHVVETRAGYKNDAKRIGGNGPMDETSRQIVSYATSFSESNFKDAQLTRVNTIMLDSLVAILSGFESEPARIAARIGRGNQGDLKSTILGYGVTTNPESAAFANSTMVRHTDYNDSDPEHGGHASSMIPGILAVGEALHSTGLEVLVAVGLAYEVLNGLTAVTRGAQGGGGGKWDGPFEGLATAVGVGKLMKLNEDKLANALSLAFVPHLPMFVSHVGALSMWKGCHSAMGVRGGVYAALLAREGMTGPAQPFEARGGWFDISAGYKEMRLPVNPDGRLAIENFRLKLFPAEGSTQGTLELIPAIREWTKVDEIESIQVEIPFNCWQEVGDPPKWDPQNRETADHSLAYLIAVALTDGEIYLGSFKPERYLHDSAIRQLMQKITIRANREFKDDNRSRLTLRKKSGEQLVKEAFEYRTVTHQDVLTKFDRVCEYMSVSNEQRDRALATWPNLRKVQDIGEPIRQMANFGKPVPL